MPGKRGTIPERFARFVAEPNENGCQFWTGGTYPNGYGMFAISRSLPARAHRVAWEMARGPIPDGVFVCHRCDTPLCVNVDHLFLGTHAENMADMVAKGRHTPTFGSLCGMAKMTEARVIEARAYHRLGVSQAALAKNYGVAPNTMNYIVNRRTWRHVP